MDAVEKKKLLRDLRARMDISSPGEIFPELKRLSCFQDDFTLQSQYTSLFRSLDKKSLDLRPIRIAILANSTVSHFIDVFEFYLAKEGLAAEIYEADYGTLYQTVLDPASPLYRFGADIVLIFTSYRDVALDVSYGSQEKEILQTLEQALSRVTSLWKAIRRNSNSYIIQNNADLPAFRTFGNYEGAVPWSWLNLLRRFNLELARAVVPGITIFDLDYISSLFGKKVWQDSRYWYHSKHLFSFDAVGLVAHEMARTVAAVKGLSKKCIVLDLDNTLWGGIIADDGLEGIILGNGPAGEAYVDFQKYLLALKKRGIMLAVCSKNYEEMAQEPFLRHPDMQLRLDDIMVFIASWDNKAESLRRIAATLNIGLDSIVFIDDNPAERLLIRQMLPQVCVPELPHDPSEFVKFLSAQSCFETVHFSFEDGQRNDFYRDNLKREKERERFSDLNEYLQSLRMEVIVGEVDEHSLPRFVQLINRTNQFNLTTIRYTEGEIRAKLANDRFYCRYFRLKDRFGDNGIIAAVILEVGSDNTLFIDSWLMSCRVLSRGMEEFICREIISIAQQHGCSRILGKYVPTKKNKLVADVYPKLGFSRFQEEGGHVLWELRLDRKCPSFSFNITRCEMNPVKDLV